MAPRMFSFQFGRLSIISTYHEDKIEFFDKVFGLNKPYSDQYNKYMFLKVQKISYLQQYFFLGKVVKYKSVDEEIVIEDSKALGLSTVKDAVVSKLDFVLHPYSSIIAYRPIPSRFSPSQFRNTFARLIEMAFDNLFISVIIEAINEESQIHETFKKFQSINMININLHPSNPNNRDVWVNIDNELIALNAKEYQQTIIGKPGGLNKESVEKSDLYSGIIMAADGYGDASVVGMLEDGTVTTISTADNPKETKVYLDDVPEKLLDQLIHPFESIWKRFNR